MYLDVLSAVVNLWLFLVILGYPFSLAVYTPHGYRGLLPPSAQPITAIGVFVLVCSMRVALSFVTRLRNPFSWTADRIKVDSLMAGSDRTVFAFLRARFDSRTATKKMSTQPEDSGMLSCSKSYSEPSNEHFSIESETSCHTEATVELGASFHSEEAVANHSPRSLPPGRGSMRRRVSNVDGTTVSNRETSIYESQEMGKDQRVEKIVSSAICKFQGKARRKSFKVMIQ